MSSSLVERFTGANVTNRQTNLCKNCIILNLNPELLTVTKMKVDRMSAQASASPSLHYEIKRYKKSAREWRGMSQSNPTQYELSTSSVLSEN